VEIFAGQHKQSRVLNHSRIGRTRFVIENSHFAKEIAAGQFRQRHFCAVGIDDADPYLATLD
jgi:hypothetical protein